MHKYPHTSQKIVTRTHMCTYAYIPAHAYALTHTHTHILYEKSYIYNI